MTSTALIETAMESGANRDPGTHRLILKWPHPHWRSSQRRRTLTVALSGRSSPAGSSIHTAFSDSHAAQGLWALHSLELAAVDAPNIAWLNGFRLFMVFSLRQREHPDHHLTVRHLDYPRCADAAATRLCRGQPECRLRWPWSSRVEFASILSTTNSCGP